MKTANAGRTTHAGIFSKRMSLILLALVIFLTMTILCGCSVLFPKTESESPVPEKIVHHVTFYANGGRVLSGSTEQDVEDGMGAVAPTVVNGSMILSWDKDFSAVTEDITVSAVWTAKTYTVTFHEDGGELVSGKLVQTVEEGKAAVAPVLTKEHFALSWDTDFSSITKDTDVHAVWEMAKMTSVEIAEYATPRVVTVETDRGTGSGFFISDNGILVTNFHVIKAATVIQVKLSNGAIYPMNKLIDFDRRYDLAILQIGLADTPYFDFSYDVKLGETVYAVGSALGTFDGTFTGGSVSSVQRTVGLIDYIQTDAAISHGNSGGPLVNEFGQVIGINAATSAAGQNLNFSIRAELLNELQRDKNYTISQYCEWYNKETARSYSPFDSENFYYSLVNRFETVTGSKCIASFDQESKYNGYTDCCYLYEYAYDISTLDAYTAYLSSVGFIYNADISEENEYYYENSDDDICIIIEVDLAENVIDIVPAKRSFLYS